jgi:adenine-specific DNA methylase
LPIFYKKRLKKKPSIGIESFVFKKKKGIASGLYARSYFSIKDSSALQIVFRIKDTPKQHYKNNELNESC